MPATIQSTGDAGLDRELDYLLQQIKALSGTSTQATVTTVPTVPQSIQTALVVQDVSGTVSLSLPGLLFDDTDGFAISQENGLARIDRSASTNAPPAVGTGAAGTAAKAANEDHTHNGVASFNGATGAVTGVASLATSGNLASVNAATGAVTITVSVLVVGADPGSPADGDCWFRSDTKEFKMRAGGTTYKSAAFT